MAKGPKPPKTHGLSHGPNLHQIVSYILLSSKIFIFQHFIASNFVMSIQVVLSLVYYAANIVVIVCGVLATICDPTDEIVKLERKSRLEGLPFETSRYEFHCEFCGTSVSHSDTKHCRSCGRCVDGFDHHCEWVNNCISKKNYRPFATLIGGLGVSTLTYVVSGLMFCVDFFSGKLQVVEDLEAVKDDLGEWQIYLIIVYTVINLVLFLLDCKLISFHLYLYKHNITTYQYIVEGREKQREKTSKKRSSLTMNKGKGKGTQKSSSAERDVEDIKDVSLHEQDKKLGEKVRLVGSVPMNRLNYRSQDNFEEAYSNDAKLGFSGNSSNAPFMMSLDKSAKVSDRSNYNHDSPKKQLISREYPYHIDFKAEAQAKQQDELSEAVNSNNGRFLSPSNMSSQLTPTQVPTSFQNFSSPSNGLLANASFPDIPQPERKDSRDFDETEPPTSAKGEGLESRQVAFSIARIADNYVPMYGKISEEEENENELPNVSDPVQDYEGKGI